MVWFLCCLSAPGVIRVQADAGGTWKWRNPLPQGAGLKALAESNGRLIAVGRAGTILTTTDGMNWTPRVSGTRNHFRGVAVSGTTAVTVGREGDIVTSTDGGLTWARRASVAAEWTGVVHGGGVWVASGFRPDGGGLPDTAVVMTSPDGLTWTSRTVPNAAGRKIQTSVWTGTRFVLAGTAVVTSEDGITWTFRDTSFGVADWLAWTGSRVVAGARSISPTQIGVSPDGITWTNVALPGIWGFFGGFVWSGTQFIGWGGYPQRLFVSPTGENWTETYPAENFDPTVAAGDGTTLLAGGDHGRMVLSNDSGLTWTEVNTRVAGNINAITRFAGRWVAAGADGVLTSSANGTTWTPASAGSLSRFRAIAWHDGLWVAGGHEEATTGFGAPVFVVPRKYSILTSTDGVTWTDRAFDGIIAGGLFSSRIFSVIHAGTQWVAAAEGAVLTSPNGITWQPHLIGNQNRDVAWNGSLLVVVGGNEDTGAGQVFTSSNGGVSWSSQAIGPFWRGVTWTGSQFVAVGDDGSIFTSPTGAEGTWTQRPTATGRDLRGVFADTTGIIAVGGSYAKGPIILTSPDGEVWTRRTAPTTQLLYSINKAGALYVATGYDGVVLTSLDAATWTARQTNTTHELYCAAWDGRQLLVSGEGGAILAGSDLSTIVPWKDIVRQPGPGLNVRLTWPAVTGSVYDIESATSLAPPWLPVPGSPRTATGAEESLNFTEPIPGDSPKRFFRVSLRQ